MDAAAVPRSHSWRPPAQVPDPRSRLHFFSRGRQRVEVIWPENIANAGAGAKGECLLRTADRHDTTRVFRLGHPAERKASAENTAGVGCTLPARTPTCKSGTRGSRTDDRATAKPTESEARVAARLSNKNKGRTQRIAFMNIGCRELPRDARLDFLRSTGDSSPRMIALHARLEF